MQLMQLHWNELKCYSSQLSNEPGVRKIGKVHSDKKNVDSVTWLRRVPSHRVAKASTWMNENYKTCIDLVIISQAQKGNKNISKINWGLF